MSSNQWNTEIIKQHNLETGQALLSDEQTLVFFSRDFGKLVQSSPAAVFTPPDTASLQLLVTFACKHQLSVVIRGNGLSQNGQSLPLPGGLTLSMQHFNTALALSGDSIWVEANSSWAALLNVSLASQKMPYVLPYNCNLSIAGVLSAGGVGASSFKYGAINSHVRALEVVDGEGNLHTVDKTSPLFHACLSGQGRFAVITKACIKLKPAPLLVKTFCLVYYSQDEWFEDMYTIQDKVDYIEAFCSPSIQGAKLKDDKRVPMAQWLYGLHVSVEYEQIPPLAEDILVGLNPWQVINEQEESISSYLLRHNSRFEAMKSSGQWDLMHPWYECFIATHVLKKSLGALLDKLPLHYATMIHVVPMRPKKGGFLMLPEGEEEICSFMILNPGVSSIQMESCLQAIRDLDVCFMKQGGKRYLSGFLGEELSQEYWQQHFGQQYASWVELKKQYDPAGIFSSVLHPE